MRRPRFGFERCDDCGEEYADDGVRVRQCPGCAEQEAAIYAIEYDTPPARYFAQHVIKERLGISGSEDS